MQCPKYLDDIVHYEPENTLSILGTKMIMLIRAYREFSWLIMCGIILSFVNPFNLTLMLSDGNPSSFLNDEALESKGLSKPFAPKDIVLQVLATSCYGLQRCITLLDHAGIILEDAVAKESSEMLLLHIRTYAWLAAYFYNQRLMVFRIRPKMHYIFHQAIQLREWKINFGVFACFHDETFLGKIKAVAKACHGSTVLHRMLQRYILCLALLVHRHEQLDTNS